MKNDTTKGGIAKRVICVIVGLILLAGVACGLAFLVKRTNGFADDFKTFYVETGGKRYFTGGDTVTLKMNSITSFKCGYSPANKELGALQTYDVKIESYATAQTEFNYTVDGKVQTFRSGTDYTDCFNVSEDKTAFTVSNVKDTPLDIVKRKNIGKTVEGEIPDYTASYFKLTVTASDGKQKIELFIKLEYFTISLPDNIIF